MPKNAKKTHPQNKRPAAAKPASKPVITTPVEAEISVPAPTPEPETTDVAPKRARILLGAISGELFESIFKPIFSSFDERRDDEPLRALVESIVTAIAMRDVYDGCRKLDDVFQRYLYYLESLMGDVDCELAESKALCDYWRSQVFMTLIRDSRVVFDLLFPDEPVKTLAAFSVDRNVLLPGLRRVLSKRVGGFDDDVKRDELEHKAIYDFARGVSFPWPGFTPERLFGLLNRVPDHVLDEDVCHEFAIVMPAQTVEMENQLRQAIHETLLIDLIAAQHAKLYAEITSAFEPGDRLPPEIIETIEKRVRFDKTYQNAYDAWLSGQDVEKPLHRSSRLDIEQLNAVGHFYSLLHEAVERHLAAYLFHYYGE